VDFDFHEDDVDEDLYAATVPAFWQI